MIELKHEADVQIWCDYQEETRQTSANFFLRLRFSNFRTFIPICSKDYVDNGHGYGYGYGFSDGNGCSCGYGYGYSSGNGYGYGDGNTKGNGYGYGFDGYGNSFGNGYVGDIAGDGETS